MQTVQLLGVISLFSILENTVIQEKADAEVVPLCNSIVHVVVEKNPSGYR